MRPCGEGVGFADVRPGFYAVSLGVFREGGAADAELGGGLGAGLVAAGEVIGKPFG